MNLWSYDAGDVNPNDISSDFIVKNQTIEQYLTASSHEKKLFLLGSKGSGKTLLLRYKAYQYWKKLEGDENKAYQTSESNELVESLYFTLGTISESDLKILAKLHNWVRIWNFALSIVIIRRSQTPMPTEAKHLDDLFPQHFGLSDIVPKLLNNCPKYILSNFLSVNTDLIASLKLIKSSFVLFVDRLDQALDNLLQKDEYKYFEDEESNNIAFTVWKVAQFGLLESIYNINSAVNSHIKIFATARMEALDVHTQLKANVSNYCATLEYTYEELKLIFVNNIKRIPMKDSFKHGEGNIFKEYFGFESMQHVHARTSDQEPMTEDVFRFIYRHTFSRPREIVLIGGEIYTSCVSRVDYSSKSFSDNVEKIRRQVNDSAFSSVLDHYLKEVVPVFKTELLDEFSHKISKNVITRNELLTIREETYNYLYRLGLLGYVLNEVQRFLPAAMYIYDLSQNIPNVEYYLVHPALDKMLQKENRVQDFYTTHNIVGNGNVFYHPPVLTSTIWSQKSLEYFLPNKIAGKSSDLTEPNFNLGVQVPLYDLYMGFFVIKRNKSGFEDFKVQKFDEALRFLSCVANIYYLSMIEVKFDCTFSNKRLELIEELKSYNGASNYSSVIKGMTDEDLYNFGKRLVGRFKTLGLYLYLRFDHSKIHTLIKEFDYRPEPNRHSQEESALRYLRKSFFVKGVKKSSLKSNDDAYAILKDISSFEREHLNKWWLHYKHHELLSNPILNEEHRDFLETELLVY